MEPNEAMLRLESYYAYDTGSVCSGVSDPKGKAEAINWAKSLTETELRIFIARCVREMWLTEEALSLGYGAEDAKEFLSWLEDHNLI